MTTSATARLNMRIAPEALDTIRRAAAAQQQDLTSFVLGAAMDRAHTVVRSWHETLLTLEEIERLEEHLNREDKSNPGLEKLFRWSEEHRIGPRTYRLDPSAKRDREDPSAADESS